MDELELGGREWVKVKPINHKTADGSIYLEPYTFSRVYIEDAKEDGVTLGGDLAYPYEKPVGLYQYDDRTEVIITQEGAMRPKNSDREDGEIQAYFSLSRLAEKGYVGRWEPE